MIDWRRTRCWAGNRELLPNGPPRPQRRTVTFVAATVRRWSDKASCTAAGFHLSSHLSEEEPHLTISPELKAQILRYAHAEHWRIGTIASQLKGHHGTVSRVITQAG